MGYQNRKKFDRILGGFDTIHECDGRTDRRTPDDGKYHAYAQRRPVKIGWTSGNLLVEEGQQFEAREVAQHTLRKPDTGQSC